MTYTRCYSCETPRTEDQLGCCAICGVPICGLGSCTGDCRCSAATLLAYADDDFDETTLTGPRCYSCKTPRTEDQLGSCPTCGVLTCGLDSCTGACRCNLSTPLADFDETTFVSLLTDYDIIMLTFGMHISC